MKLTLRDIQLLRMAADGAGFKEIGREFGLKEQSVKNRSRRVRDKLGADNITQAVAMALRRKIIE